MRRTWHERTRSGALCGRQRQPPQRVGVWGLCFAQPLTLGPLHPRFWISHSRRTWHVRTRCGASRRPPTAAAACRAAGHKRPGTRAAPAAAPAAGSPHGPPVYPSNTLLLGEFRDISNRVDACQQRAVAPAAGSFHGPPVQPPIPLYLGCSDKYYSQGTCLPDRDALNTTTPESFSAKPTH